MKGPKYHKIYHRIWANPEFRSHSEDARTAVLYLSSCPHRNTEGLFRLPLPFAQYELQWSEERTVAALVELVEAGFIRWDRPADLVWLVDALETDPPVGPKQIQGAVNRLAETPSTVLRSEYLVRCRELCPGLAEQLSDQLGWQPIDTHPKGYPKGSDTPSIAHAHAHAHAHPHPQAPPVDNLDAPHRGDDDELTTATTTEVADRLIELLGYIDELANGGERRLVAKLMERGMTIDQLEDLAYDAARRDNVKNPRNYLYEVLTDKLNSKEPMTKTTSDDEDEVDISGISAQCRSLGQCALMPACFPAEEARCIGAEVSP